MEKKKEEKKPITSEEFYKKALGLLDTICFTSILNAAGTLITIDSIKKIHIPEPLEELLVREKLDNRYSVVIVDLTKNHDNEECELKFKTYSALTLVRADSDFSFRINSKADDATPVKEGQTFTLQMEIEKIYVTNEVAEGSAVFFLTRLVD